MISRSQMNRQLYNMGGEGIMQVAPQQDSMPSDMQGEQYRPVAENLANDPKQAIEVIVKMLMEQGIPEEEARRIAMEMIQTVAQTGSLEEFDNEERVEARFGGRMGYADGGIGSLVNREQYGFGSSFGKVFKKATSIPRAIVKGVKKVAQSPIGRIALTIGATMALGPAGLNIGAGMSPFIGGAMRAGLANLAVQAASGQGIDLKQGLIAAGLGGITSSIGAGTTGQGADGGYGTDYQGATNFAPDPFQEAALGNPTVSAFEPSAFAPDPFQAAAVPSPDTYANIAGGAADIGGEAAYTSAFDYQNTPSVFDTSAQASITGGPGTGIPASDFSDYLNKGIDYPVYDPTDLGGGVVGIEPTLGKFGQTTGLSLDNPELAGFTNVEGGSPMNILGPGGRVETFKEALGQGNYLDALKQVSGAAMDYPLTTIGGISTLASAMTPEIPEQLPGESMEEYRARVAEFERQYASNLSGRTGPSLPASANNPFYPVYAARGGRIGYAFGDLVRSSGVVSATMNAGDAPSSDISGSGMGGLLVRLIRNNPNIFSVVKNTPSPLNTMQKLLARYYGNVNPTLNSEEVEKYAREKAAYGGRMGYAYGSVDEGIMATPQIANMMGMPVGNPRQNQQGVSELDYRDQGGFVPPIGVKERADDIPAMLSNNEFVFTADAVKNAGGGDPNVGAQKMYTLMKRLESGGRV
jgi:hypothetical protein